ncbi:MAG: DUF4214 domain-containing protein, partial [Acidobacteria bacterium]|nr:DUF4214 domain-containing protein [Acidobacteriota bacterium]
INPTSQNFSASGSNGIINVSSTGSCSYTAISNASWITINSGTPGTAPGTVNFTVSANTGPNQRTGTITIAGQTFTVTQDGLNCSYSISPTSQSFNASGGANSVAVTATAGCVWTATSNDSWITVPAGAGGTASGTLNYTVAANSGPARTGTLTVAGQTVTITQASGCTYTLTPTSQNFPSSVAAGAVNVTTSGGCTWTAASNSSFITITAGAAGTGNGTVNYSLTANPDTTQRTGTLSIAGQTFTVTQDGLNCSYSISPTAQSLTAAGGTNNSVSVTATAGCAWTATSNDSWLSINAGASGTGNGTVTYTVAANTGPARTGTLTIAGQTFTVTQASGCTYSITPTAQNFSASGGANSITVTAGGGCGWTAVSNSPSFITITSGASGTGNGTVSYTVAANSSTSSRSGTITIAGQTFTVMQDAATTASPTAQLSAANYNLNEADGHATIIVNRTGDASGAATINYATTDSAGLNPCNLFNGIASQRCDYALSIGTLRFAAGETSKTIFIPIVDDAYAEGAETFSITLSNPSGLTLGSTSTATITITDNESVTGTNPLDGNAFFVRQHYIDFLGREPEPAGLAGWLNVFNNFGVTIAQPCDRIEVSSGFFRSEEFQTRGYFVYRFYSAVGRIPLYGDFMPDFAKVSGFLSAQQLEDNKVAFVQEFMSRADYQTKYGSITDPTAYVTALLQTLGLPSHPGKTAWINSLTSGAKTKAQVLREVTESNEVYQKYYTEAFVIMQYFGYLRRSADGSYVNWIQTMNSTGGDYRIMINGFLNSQEYRGRFGP